MSKRGKLIGEAMVNGQMVRIYDRRTRGTQKCMCCNGTGKHPKYFTRFSSLETSGGTSSWESPREALARAHGGVVTLESIPIGDLCHGGYKKERQLQVALKELIGGVFRTELPEQA